MLSDMSTTQTSHPPGLLAGGLQRTPIISHGAHLQISAPERADYLLCIAKHTNNQKGSAAYIGDYLLTDNEPAEVADCGHPLGSADHGTVSTVQTAE